MSGLAGGDRGRSLGVEEVSVTLRINEGKLTAESTSGPKAGSIHLETTDDGAELVLSGTGRDRAAATLSRPEISAFRSALEGALAGDPPASTAGDDARHTGEATLQRIDGGIAVAIDDAAIDDLDLPDGTDQRQVPCTIRPDGVAVIDLPDAE